MKQLRFILASIAVIAIAVACQKNIDQASSIEALKADASQKGTAGYVYTLNNQTNNSVLVYARTAGGTLSFAGDYSTGGAGTGAGLGSQGALCLTNDNQLLAVNAGDNTISSFHVSGGGLQLQSTVSSGGMMPISVTSYNDIVYVLNAGGNGNVTGFHLQADGSLQPIAGSTRPLSSNMSGPAQVSFIASGKAIVVTEKATNMIITYSIADNGIPGMMHHITSAHPTPFGFAVGKKGLIYVSEAAGGAPNASGVSAYQVTDNGMISLASGPALAGQTAACWVVTTNNGKYVYATNTGSNNISSFTTNNSGDLSILAGAAAGAGASPIDAAMSNNSKFLYVLNAGSSTITAYTAENDGSLEHIQTVTGLPSGTVGLAAK